MQGAFKIVTPLRWASIALVAALAACSGSGTSPVTPTQENLAANVLQLSVGTANIQGNPGLNVAVTYRQPQGALHPGDSAVFVNTPKLSGPAALPAAPGSPNGFFSTVESGPAPVELGTRTMTGTQQTGGTPTTFGTSGGAYGLGIEPYNASENGGPDAVPPYTQPLYDPGNACSSSSCAPDPNAFVPWGGPPAFDPNHDGQGVRDGKVYPAGTLGLAEGLDVFANMTPAAGPYSLSVTIPANNGTASFTTNAGLGNAHLLLPLINPPTPALDGKGGATVAVGTLGGGITEAYVQIVDTGPPGASSSSGGCNGSNPGTPTYYTLVVRPGATTGRLGDASGPLGTPSICSAAQNSSSSSGGAGGDTFTVQVIAFDYPWYEASYPMSNGNPAPKIVGGAGQSDISISPQATCTQAASGPYGCTTPSSDARLRHPGSARRSH